MFDRFSILCLKRLAYFVPMCPFLLVPFNILLEILFNVPYFRLIIPMGEVLLRKLTKTLRLSQSHKQLLFINFENLLRFLFIQCFYKNKSFKTVWKGPNLSKTNDNNKRKINQFRGIENDHNDNIFKLEANNKIFKYFLQS